MKYTARPSLLTRTACASRTHPPTHIHTHTHTHTYKPTHPQTYTPTHPHTHTCADARISTSTRKRRAAHAHARARTSRHTYNRYKDAYRVGAQSLYSICLFQGLPHLKPTANYTAAFEACTCSKTVADRSSSTASGQSPASARSSAVSPWSFFAVASACASARKSLGKSAPRTGTTRRGLLARNWYVRMQGHRLSHGRHKCR